MEDFALLASLKEPLAQRAFGLYEVTICNKLFGLTNHVASSQQLKKGKAFFTSIYWLTRIDKPAKLVA